MSKSTSLRLASKLIHGGIERTPFGETSDAMFITSGFVYESAEQAERTFTNEEKHYQYSRFGNPTNDALARRLADLEGAEACITTSTGMSAVMAGILSLIKAGDRVVASRALFGSSYWIIQNYLPSLGIETCLVDGGDEASWANALNQPTAVVLIETPSNPMLDVLDISMIARLSHKAGAKLVVDNVFATPIYQKPITFGADLVVYSCTKHIDGQGRVLGGAILGSEQVLNDHVIPFVRNMGLSLSPFNAWVLLKGLETMTLRVEKMTKNALLCAEFLEKSPFIARVFYPGLKSHPQYELAKKQMSDASTMIALEIKGGKEAAFAFMNALNVILISNNLGDCRSLMTHPATTTHMKVSMEDKQRLGITDGAIRFSVGLEDPQDLIEDLARGLEAVAACSKYT